MNTIDEQLDFLKKCRAGQLARAEEKRLIGLEDAYATLCGGGRLHKCLESVDEIEYLYHGTVAIIERCFARDWNAVISEEGAEI
jgi:hypothetical protein